MTISHAETVLVAQSDDHLAAVEEAKRTGLPLVSVAAKGSNVVPLDVAWGIAEAKAQENTYVGRFGATYAAHLQDYHEAVRANPDFIGISNEEKARQHAEYSDQLIRARREQEAETQKKLDAGFDVSLAVQQANLDRAQEHEQHAHDYELQRREREASATPVLNVIDETVKLLNTGLVSAPLSERVDEMAKLSSVTVPDAMERSTNDALVVKDRIIASEVPYADHVASHDEQFTLDHPALAVLNSVDSPEELEGSTREAQIAASRVTQDSFDLQDGSKEG